MTPRAPVLRVRDLHKQFTLHLRQGSRLPVLRGIDFELYGGECVALVGASGSGKSTLLKCLYGSYGVEHGGMLYTAADGHEIDLAQATPQRMLALREREIAYVSQFLRVVPRVGALDIVAERALALADVPPGGASFDGRVHQQRREAARQPARALLDLLEVPAALWTLPPATFSGGEQQRVNIARGFVVPARLLLLDEPTAALDRANRQRVIALIRQARDAGCAIVGIFHDEEVRDAVATRCLRLERGALQ